MRSKGEELSSIVLVKHNDSPTASRSRILLSAGIGSLALLMFAGCFSYDEEIWVKKEGGAKVKIDFFVPEPMDQLLAANLAGSSQRLREELGDRLLDLKIGHKRGSRLTFTYEYEKGEAPDLAALSELPIGEPLEFKRIGLLNYRFEKRIPGSRDLPDMGRYGNRRDQPGFRYRVTAHLPWPIAEANATRTDGTTAIWELTPAEAMQGMVLHATTDRLSSLKWTCLAGMGVLLGILLLALLGVGVVLIVRSRGTYPGRA